MPKLADSTVFVTGGTGFIARHLITLLADSANRLVISGLENSFSSNIEYIQLDISDKEKVALEISRIKPNILINLAGITGKAAQVHHISEKMDSINADAAIFLSKCAADNGASRVILFGTAAEYGDNPTPFTEDMETRPFSAYAVSKARAAKLAADEFQANGLPSVILRLFSVYGYGQPVGMFLSQLISKGLVNETFKMSDGNQRRDMIHVSDIARAIIAAAVSDGVTGEIFNIGSGSAICLRDLALKTWIATGADPEKLQIGEVEKIGDDGFDTEADITKARDILQWTPEVSLEKGLSMTIDQYRREKSAAKGVRS